jgi:hypothetical protein
MVTIYTTCFNIEKLCTFPAHCSFVFHMIPIVNNVFTVRYEVLFTCYLEKIRASK